MAVTFTLEDEIDVSRGDLITSQTQPEIADSFQATIVWMAEQVMAPGRQYIFKLATRSVPGSVSKIDYRIDVNTLEQFDATELQLNEIATCTVSVNAPVVFDPYQKSKGTGSFIIIDRLTNVTVGAGMISGVSDQSSFSHVTPEERSARFGQNAISIGLTGANAHEAAYQLERKLFDSGHAATILENQDDNLNRYIDIIKHAGLIVLCPGCSDKSLDIRFDTENNYNEQIFASLKAKKIISLE